MNKSNFFLFFLFYANALFAQIAIDSTGVDKQTIIDITTPNKAVLFPRIDNIMNKNDLSFLKENWLDATPEGLLVYNNSILEESLERGYYYWSNNQWNLLIDDDTVYSRLTIDKVSNTQTKKASYIKNFFANNEHLPIAEFNDSINRQNGFTWVELDGLDYTFDIINNHHNNVFVKVSGIAQYASSNYNNLITGMNLGVFLQHVNGVDNKFRLQGISVKNSDNSRNSNCHLFNYSLQIAIGKLSPGTYRIKSFVSGNRNYNNQDEIRDKWITVGGKATTDNTSTNADCTNSTNEQLVARQTVVIIESEN